MAVVGPPFSGHTSAVDWCRIPAFSIGEREMRLKRTLMALAGALALAGTVAPVAQAQYFGEYHFRNREWVLLGQQEVGFRVDRDIINISHNEDWYRSRAFRALHFVAHGNDVQMIAIRL